MHWPAPASDLRSPEYCLGTTRDLARRRRAARARLALGAVAASEFSRSYFENALEGLAECGLGLIADQLSDLSDLGVCRSQQFSSLVEATTRQVTQRWLTDQSIELGRKRGSRHPELLGERSDRPAGVGSAMDERQRGPDFRIGQGAEPAALGSA